MENWNSSICILWHATEKISLCKNYLRQLKGPSKGSLIPLMSSSPTKTWQDLRWQATTAPRGSDLLKPEGMETRDGMALMSWPLPNTFLPSTMHGMSLGMRMSNRAISPLARPMLILWISSLWPVLSQQQLHAGATVWNKHVQNVM